MIKLIFKFLKIFVQKRYGLYSDPQNKAFATLISNTDISNSLSVNTTYRIVQILLIIIK